MGKSYRWWPLFEVESKVSMINQIINCMNNKNIKFWVLNEIEYDSHELYTIGHTIESQRKVLKSFYKVTLYVDHSSYTGSTTIKIPFGIDNVMLDNMVNKAIEDAKLVCNQRYEIVQTDYTYKDLNYNLGDNVLNEAAEYIKSSRDVNLSSSEIFVKNVVQKFYNAAGNSYVFKSGSIVLDMVILSADNEVESECMREAQNLKMLDLPELFKQEKQFIQDLRFAKLPKTGKFKVVFTGELLEEFFSFFIFHSLGSSAYNKYSLFRKDERVTNMDLTIHSRPFIPGFHSGVADSLGYPLKDFTILEKGILKNIVANAKYAQYLNIDFTGELGNIVIEGGNLSYNDMISEDGVIVVSKISSFSPNDLTGDFAAEIRLAHLVKDGVKHTLKGGSFSGNIREFNEIYLSKEIVSINSYIGPRAVCLDGVTISGE